MKLTIEKFRKRETSQMMCCSYDDCFELAEWFVEGFPYCTKHKEKLEEIAKEVSHEKTISKY